MNTNTAKKVSLALSLSSVAVGLGDVAVKAGPALQTLNNLTNTAEFSINNTYGQSFSADGIMNTAVVAGINPFSSASAAGSVFNALTATLNTGFVGDGMGRALNPVTTVTAFATMAALTAAVVMLNASTATGLGVISLAGTSGTQTIGASISSTLFGPSTVKATTSFTNQLINDLSAF